MKILVCSHVFAPSVGGTETVGRLLAEEFAAAGHEVQVATETSGESVHPFPVHRRPSPAQLMRLVVWADLVFHNHISLRAAWPLLLVGRPWVVTHHTWIDSRLKKRLSRFGKNIAISSAIARSIPARSEVIPDPYDARVFQPRKEIPRDLDLIFVGRLVSDKGADLLIEAAAQLNCRVTIVGDGPERQVLAAKRGAAVRFTGTLPPEGVARELNRHRICVVPSRWNEPFGVVALEAIACGCAVAGSSGGGLPEAIGACGRTFPNGDAAALAAVLREMLSADLSEFTKSAEAHLKLHHPAAIARRYLQVFEKVP